MKALRLLKKDGPEFLRENEATQREILETRSVNCKDGPTVLIWGAGCALGTYLKKAFERSGSNVACSSVSMNIDDPISHRTIDAVIWLRGLTRPQDKIRATGDHLQNAMMNVEEFERRILRNYHVKKIAIMGSNLQLDPATAKLGYSQVKTQIRVMIQELTDTPLLFYYLPNNEGFLRAYDHWLQTLLLRMCKLKYLGPRSVESSGLYYNPNRHIDIASTHEISDALVRLISEVESEKDISLSTEKALSVGDLIEDYFQDELLRIEPQLGLIRRDIPSNTYSLGALCRSACSVIRVGQIDIDMALLNRVELNEEQEIEKM